MRKIHYIKSHCWNCTRAKGLFKYLVVVNETEVPCAFSDTRWYERMVRWRTGVCKNGGKAFPPSGGEQEASRASCFSSLPPSAPFFHSLSLALSLPLPVSFVSICLRLFPLPRRPPNSAPLISVSWRSREMVSLGESGRSFSL